MSILDIAACEGALALPGGALLAREPADGAQAVGVFDSLPPCRLKRGRPPPLAAEVAEAAWGPSVDPVSRTSYPSPHECIELPITRARFSGSCSNRRLYSSGGGSGAGTGWTGRAVLTRSVQHLPAP